jgi:diaminohydroxyphosphoribosylaminopyrimidine deaminase / 5-amino-6-(5-phosphoribosylamino)uracil reductase
VTRPETATTRQAHAQRKGTAVPRADCGCERTESKILAVSRMTVQRMSERDEHYMGYALDLARRGRGLASPNPMVGAVLVQGDRVIGEGFHRYNERKHAEVWALEDAKEQALGTTLYVNLEPCSHFGRTPPCVDRLIRAGVERVVAAMQDPNPLVAGNGFRKLQTAGIALTTGVCEPEALKLNEAYCKFVRTRKPFVTLKVAMTLDGKIAEANGHALWITGELARQRVQQLRFETDAVLTGIGTVLADDPLLTDRTHQPRRRQLVRVVVDTHLRLPVESRLVRSRSEGDIIMFCSDERDADKQQLLEEAGVEIVPVSPRQNKIPFATVLDELGRREVTSLLIEAGSEVNFEALRSGSVDKLFCFIAPKLLGGTSPLPVVGGGGFLHLDQAVPLTFASTEQVGDDLLIEAYMISKQ